VWSKSQNENPESKCGLNKSCFLFHVTGAFNELGWSLIITIWPSVQGWVWKCLKVLKSFWRVYTGLHLDSKNSKPNLNSSGSVKESPFLFQSFISKALSNSLQLLVDSLLFCPHLHPSAGSERGHSQSLAAGSQQEDVEQNWPYLLRNKENH